MIYRIIFCIIFNCFVLIASGRDYSIVEFGAKSDGKSNNSQAFQRAIDACSNEGGGIVSIPSGTWLTGTVFLKSNVSINLSGGAIWKAINDTLAFPYLKTIVMSRENAKPALSMIYASNVDRVKIYGEGILDGGGEYEIFQVRNQSQKERHLFRPYGIYMVNCSNITVDGIMMQNSAMWMQRYQNCKKLKLSNLTVFNSFKL